jgi:hypothetical protein
MIRPTTNKTFAFQKSIPGHTFSVMRDAGVKMDDYSHAVPLGMMPDVHIDDADAAPKIVRVRQSPFPSTFHKRGTTYSQAQRWRKPNVFSVGYGDVGQFNTRAYVRPSLVDGIEKNVVYNGRVVKAGDNATTSNWKYKM